MGFSVLVTSQPHYRMASRLPAPYALFRRKKGGKPAQMRAVTRQSIKKYFEDDVRALEAIFGQKISVWKTSNKLFSVCQLPRQVAFLKLCKTERLNRKNKIDARFHLPGINNIQPLLANLISIHGFTYSQLLHRQTAQPQTFIKA